MQDCAPPQDYMDGAFLSPTATGTDLHAPYVDQLPAQQ